MTAASRLSGQIRPIAYQTLIGLLATTGMRISEALALNDTNVEFDAGLITVRNSKFNKSRQLPLHPTTIEALQHYVTSRRNTRADDIAGDGQAFFISDTGRRIDYRQCREVFVRCLDQANVTAPAGRRRPRIHDLRHTFAVNTLIDWYSNGVNVNAYLPYLSTYLGHISPAATYWYFHRVARTRRCHRFPPRLHRCDGEPVTSINTTLQRWFTQRLINEQHVSGHTISAYRDTIRLLLGFIHDRDGLTPCELDFEHLNATVIGAFLTWLETDRHVSIPHATPASPRSDRSSPTRRSITPNTPN